MAAAASPGRRSGEADRREDASFPARDVMWRKKTAPSPEAADYIATRRTTGGFYFAHLQRLVTAGKMPLAEIGGGSAHAAEGIQSVRPEEVEYARNFTGRAKHLYS